MKIAYVTPYLPVPPDTGGKIRTWHLLRGLARHHEVDLFTVHYGVPPDTTGVEAVCRTLTLLRLEDRPQPPSLPLWAITGRPKPVDHFQSPPSLREMRALLEARTYDLLVIDEVCMADYATGLPGPKLIVRHKVDHRHLREVASAMPWGPHKRDQLVDAIRMRVHEKRVMKGFDAVVCCSDDDARLVRALTPGARTTVIGNGVDLEYFSPIPEYAGPPTLLYLGTMNYYPNVDAILFFFREIYPRLVALVPDVRIRIVGQGPPAEVRDLERIPGVEVIGAVPDVRPHIATCSALIVPLRLGGGTRLKILEASAAGRAVVSTSVGAEGLGLRHREHLLLADRPTEFARAAAELVRDVALRHRLAASARGHVCSHFSWYELGDRFATVASGTVLGERVS